VFTLAALPRRVLVIGAGYIGVEMAHIFAGLGSRVVVVMHGDAPLRGFDAEVRAAVAAGLRAHGIELHPSCEPLRVDAAGDALDVPLSVGRTAQADVVLAAVGRAPSTAGIGLEALGVELDDRGGVVVDEWQRTSAGGIYAVGDVTGRLGLTPIAIREGHAFADTVFGRRPTPFVPDHVPTAVFAQPPVATVGLTEEAARARGDALVYRSTFKPMRHALTGRDDRVLIKVVVDPSTRRVLGLHMVGDDAPEIVQAAAIAIAMGATKEDLDRTVAIHPTVAEELVLLR
jgi:glutathione reductase (NADPH)